MGGPGPGIPEVALSPIPVERILKFNKPGKNKKLMCLNWCAVVREGAPIEHGANAVDRQVASDVGVQPFGDADVCSLPHHILLVDGVGDVQLLDKRLFAQRFWHLKVKVES